MIRHFCDKCGNEVTDGSATDKHWLGRYKVTKDISVVIEARFEGELCLKCRREFAKQVTIADLERSEIYPLM